MKKLLLLLLLISLILTGCHARPTPLTECVYHYTDLDGNQGEFYFCGEGVGYMYCMSGDHRYKVQVKEYHLVCEKKEKR